ncbi:TetR family transcriptional regulator [Actinoplanes sp. NBRC 14428]|uniref:TetR family transcriptional regulator n=1 Tax=Pseudosporangium ferrugineum TaxID=439699 RepID=A0A2T0SCZ7_9ACTN|nr:TetR family transcriptional regulator [Pseudosporangium ferrugineum]PRY31282.1 TetR family transcriptional regulator [Pseudosporangium ferrugineum]BCJ54581.1 TetR family transcriptional regulator [Actinoplanes sp. NBRC 14428]
MPRNGDEVKRRLQDAALEMFTERGFDHTSAADIAARAGVTERTFFRHFTDKREVFFDGQDELLGTLLAGLAAVPAGTKPMAALRAAFHGAVPLLEANLPVVLPRLPIIAATPALKERSLAKTQALAEALAAGLAARGVPAQLASLCAQAAMVTFGLAVRRWHENPSTGPHEHLDEAFRELRLATAALKQS